jgi:hypothetical protein
MPFSRGQTQVLYQFLPGAIFEHDQYGFCRITSVEFRETRVNQGALFDAMADLLWQWPDETVRPGFADPRMSQTVATMSLEPQLPCVFDHIRPCWNAGIAAGSSVSATSCGGLACSHGTVRRARACLVSSATCKRITVAGSQSCTTPPAGSTGQRL